MVLFLEYMVVAAIYIIIPGYYLITSYKCPLVYKIIMCEHALFKILIFKCKAYSKHDFVLFNSCSSNKEILIINKFFCFKSNMP